METALQNLLSWNFLLLCLTIAAINFSLRKITDYCMVQFNLVNKFAKFYNDVFLPLSPILTGLLFCGVATKYPYSSDIVSLSGRLSMGLTAGSFSSIIYRVIRSMIKSNIKAVSGGQIDLGDSAPPTPLYPSQEPGPGQSGKTLDP